MLDNKFYEGFECEGYVKIWNDDNGEENGFVIWEGYFYTLLEGCYYSDYSSNGIIECYVNHEGFFDDKWEMRYPLIVLDELRRFDKQSLHTKNEDIINISQEIAKKLVSYISSTISLGKRVFVEHN